MRVLLINPNRMKPAIAPVGLDYLADSLEAAGHEPRLLDLCFADDIPAAITRSLLTFAPQVIGLTVRNTDDCYFSTQTFFLPDVQRLVRQLRQGCDAPIVLGGVGFSVAPEAVFEYCGADLAITGEGEWAFVRLLEALERRMDLSTVPNLIYRDGTARRRTPMVPVDLAALPVRRRALVDNRLYFRKGGQAGFETKRGCPMRCVYCADPVAKGHTSRLLPPDKVVAELTALLAQGIDHLHTCDCEFNLPPGHALEVCHAIVAAGLGDRIRWYAYCCPAPFDDEMAALFKRAGCAGIDFGVDSGSDAVLRELGRHFTADDVAQTARCCRRHGIPFMYDLLLGGPGETRATARQSIEFMRRIQPDCVGLSIGVRLYEGTALSRQLRALGDLDLNRAVHGASRHPHPLLKPVFYFAPDCGSELPAFVRELVAGDPRFFLPDDSAENANYNYNDNADLTRAIEGGARGAYWDILRRQRGLP